MVIEDTKTNALRIESVSDAEQAAQEGVKLIPVSELPENLMERDLVWVDTPSNRALLEAYCATVAKGVPPKAPVVLVSRDKKLRGIIKKAYSHRCRMDGCTGHRMSVQWDDGRYTFPCSKGCSSVFPNAFLVWRII